MTPDGLPEGERRGAAEPGRPREAELAWPGGPTRRRVIGLALNTLFDGYEEAIWASVVRAAEELGFDLLCFLCGALGEASPRTAVFDLIDDHNVDGLIVLTASVGMFSGSGAVADMLEHARGIPMLSVSEQLDGVPSLGIENGRGVAAMTEHLVTAHARRRIAFIQGPPGSIEARIRFEAYREALARCGVPPDPCLVVEGEFDSASGARAVRTLLDERGAAIDAIVACNDVMALAAMDELRSRGVRVPEDVAVGGFDDTPAARTSSPPLTTVRQPLAELGREAARRILRLVGGERLEPLAALPTELVIRQSCGCPTAASLARAPPDVRRAIGDPALPSLSSRLERDHPGMGARLRAPGWAGELDAALADPGDGERALLTTLERLISRDRDVCQDGVVWHEVVREAVSRVVEEAASPEALRQASRLAADAHHLVGSLITTAQSAARARADEEMQALHRLIQPFPFPDDAFAANLVETLKLLHVRSFFLARYLRPDRREAELVVHHDPDCIAEIHGSADCFPARRLLPGRFAGLRRRAHVVLPIDSPGGPIGFALCEIGTMSASAYDVLLHEIGMVLSVNGLVAEVQEQHRRLLETARHAGMAEVAVGVLHNIGNLFTSVSVSAEQIRATAEEAGGSSLRKGCSLLSEHAAELPRFFASDPRAALLPSWFQQASDELYQKLARIQAESTNLLARTGIIRESIRSIQDQVRRTDLQQLETVDLAVLVQAAVEIQRAQLDRWGVRVTQRLPPLPPLMVPRSRLVHVLVNLVKNAVEAMRSTPEGARHLAIEACAEDGTVRLDLRDSGAGIAPGDLERIFSYGFTTKPDGHGFGLHTCASYMKQMGGSIRASSEGPGRGASFTLVLGTAGKTS